MSLSSFCILIQISILILQHTTQSFYQCVLCYSQIMNPLKLKQFLCNLLMLVVQYVSVIRVKFLPCKNSSAQSNCLDIVALQRQSYRLHVTEIFVTSKTTYNQSINQSNNQGRCIMVIFLSTQLMHVSISLKYQ